MTSQMNKYCSKAPEEDPVLGWNILYLGIVKLNLNGLPSVLNFFFIFIKKFFIPWDFTYVWMFNPSLAIYVDSGLVAGFFVNWIFLRLFTCNKKWTASTQRVFDRFIATVETHPSHFLFGYVSFRWRRLPWHQFMIFLLEGFERGWGGDIEILESRRRNY
jgi:hypothetical protein